MTGHYPQLWAYGNHDQTDMGPASLAGLKRETSRYSSFPNTVHVEYLDRMLRGYSVHVTSIQRPFIAAQVAMQQET